MITDTSSLIVSYGNVGAALVFVIQDRNNLYEYPVEQLAHEIKATWFKCGWCGTRGFPAILLPRPLVASDTSTTTQYRFF